MAIKNSCLALFLLVAGGAAAQDLAPPESSRSAGFYTSPFDLDLSHPDPEVQIHYTLDGSLPTQDSPVFEGPIPITDRSGLPNSWSTIPTTFVEGYYAHQPPAGPVPKATVLRAAAFRDRLRSEVITQTFFVFPEGPGRHSLPVISIVVDSLGFFGFEDGIYVPGQRYEEGKDDTGNYYRRGRASEREASFEFFDVSGERQVAQHVGVRIHGGFTRRYAHKSLRIYARDEYGDGDIDYPFFSGLPYDSYERLILRNSGNDNGLSMFRDAAAQQAVEHFQMDTQAHQPSVLYLNGEYWGIHNIRERFDDNYLDRVYGVDNEEIDYLTNRWEQEYGDNSQYAWVVNFIDRENLAIEQKMRRVETLIDIDNYLDYYAAQIYFINTDWPYGNIDFWRTRTPFTPDAPPGRDGRWRWLLYDVDLAFGLINQADFDMMNHVTKRFLLGDQEWPNLIFRNLLENDSFKRNFINRVADHLNSSFKPQRVTAIMDSLQALIEPEMAEHIHRWSRPVNMGQWRFFAESMRRHARARPQKLRENIRSHFSLGRPKEITINVEQPDRGSVRVNTLLLDGGTPGVTEQPYPWSGIYFSGLPIRLEAKPELGSAFSHWLVNGRKITGHQLTIDPDSVETATAHFSEFSLADVAPFAIRESFYLFTEWDEDRPVSDYPPSAAFVTMDESHPTIESAVAGLFRGSYEEDGETPVIGRDEEGVSFQNQPGSNAAGGLIVALDTRDSERVEVVWSAGTEQEGAKEYAIRLQYRTDEEMPFHDLRDQNGDVVEYVASPSNGETEWMPVVDLPADALGEPRVELFWRTYYTGREKSDGEDSDELRIGTIHVRAASQLPEPKPYSLADSTYQFSSWPANRPVGASPPSMKFVYMNEAEPRLGAEIMGFTSGGFNYSSRTRVNGLGEDGVSFVNTGNLEGNPGYPGRRLGGALLSLNTSGEGDITVRFEAGTVERNSRIYHLRLQYRTGEDQPFRDVNGPDGRPIEYEASSTPGHQQLFEAVKLPPDAEDNQIVQLFWRYFYTGTRLDEDDGSRSMLRLSDLEVTSKSLLGTGSGPPQRIRLFQNYPNPFNPTTTIRFDLPEPSEVKLDLYSVDGRKVATLVNSQLSDGRHQVELDASNLASGIYFYTLSAGGRLLTQKLTVVK